MTADEYDGLVGVRDAVTRLAPPTASDERSGVVTDDGSAATRTARVHRPSAELLYLRGNGETDTEGRFYV